MALTSAACGGGTTAAAAGPAAARIASKPSLPKFLPKPGAVNRLLDGTLARPTLGIEGDTEVITVPGGHFTALVVGPQVPEAGVAPIPNYSDVLFQLTLSAATGRVPLSSSDFTVTDELGRVSRPELIVSKGPITTVGPVPTGAAAVALGHVPTSIPTGGRTLIVDIIDPQIAIGDGKLAWAPGTGGHNVAAWDFSVEVD